MIDSRQKVRSRFYTLKLSKAKASFGLAFAVDFSPSQLKSQPNGKMSERDSLESHRKTHVRVKAADELLFWLWLHGSPNLHPLEMKLLTFAAEIIQPVRPRETGLPSPSSEALFSSPTSSDSRVH